MASRSYALAIATCAALASKKHARIFCADRSEVRVGIVGTGWGVKVQVPQFRAAGLSIKALYSRDNDRAKKLAQEHDVPHGFSKVSSLAACPEVDLVSVVGPTYLRKQHVLEAIAAGKSVIADKPMAMSAKESKDMVAAAAKLPPGKISLLDFELRCVPAVRRARELIAQGAIGSPAHATFRVLANFGFLGDDATHSHWNSREAGGGVFSAVGTHFVDTARFVFKDEIAKVSAIESALVTAMPPNNTPVTAEGYVSANMVTDTRQIPVHILICGRTPGAPPENGCVIVGSKGTISINFMTSELKVFCTGCEQPIFSLPPTGNAWAEVGTRELARRIKAYFVEGTDISDLATFADGLQVQLVTDAVHHSASCNGEWVSINRS